MNHIRISLHPIADQKVDEKLYSHSIFHSGLTGLLVFSSSIEFPFFLQLGVTSHYNPVVNMKPLTHYSMLLYKQLPRETGQVSSGEGGRGVFLIFALPYRYLPPQRVWVCTVLV